MKPECLPISLTRPTPLGVELASVRADLIDSVARVNAVWKPKLWSMYGTSLSIVFGTPTTASVMPSRSAASAILAKLTPPRQVDADEARRCRRMDRLHRNISNRHRPGGRKDELNRKQIVVIVARVIAGGARRSVWPAVGLIRKGLGFEARSRK